MGVFANTLLHRFFFLSIWYAQTCVRVYWAIVATAAAVVVLWVIIVNKYYEKKDMNDVTRSFVYSKITREFYVYFFLMLLFRSFVCHGTVFARLKDCVRDDERERKVNHIDFTIEMPLNRSQLLYVCVVCERCVRCAPFDVFVLCVITINWSQISIFSFFLLLLCFAFRLGKWNLFDFNLYMCMFGVRLTPPFHFCLCSHPHNPNEFKQIISSTAFLCIYEFWFIIFDVCAYISIQSSTEIFI